MITIYSPSCLGQETAKGPFGFRVKLPPAHLSTHLVETQVASFPPAYHTRWWFHTAPFIADHQAGKLWIPIFIVLIPNFIVLTNRQQYTVVHQVESSVKSVSCGVPQGLTLGPLLFLIYINDLPNVCNLRIRLFADDASLTMSNKSESLLENHMNNELIKVDEWSKTNKLSLNYDKTEFLVVNKSKSKGGSLNIRIGKHDNCSSQACKVFGSNNWWRCLMETTYT